MELRQREREEREGGERGREREERGGERRERGERGEKGERGRGGREGVGERAYTKTQNTSNSNLARYHQFCNYHGTQNHTSRLSELNISKLCLLPLLSIYHN